MTWKIKGKIGCQFPERTGLNPNFDVTQIFYSEDGVEANVKHIERVYFLPPSAAANIDSMSTTDLKKSELERWLVWQRYWESAPVVRQLAQGSGYYVMQKYEPGLSDVTATTISVFTTRNATSNRCLFILDDNGILVGKSNDETITSMELHGLEGYKRTMTFSPSFTFRAGKTYWLQYYYDGNSSAPDAYYTNEQGLDYKNLSCNGHQSDTPVDTSSMNYIGELFQSNTQMADIMVGILQLNQGDVFKPRRNSEYPIQGMTINRFYERNSNYLNKTITQVDHSSLPSDKDKPRNSELASMNAGDLLVIGYDNSGNGMVYVYERSAISIPSEITDYSQVQSYSSIANWMVEMNVTGKACTFSSGNWNWPYANPSTDGSIYKRTSNGNLKFSSANDKITSAPASPVVGNIYYKDTNLALPGVEQYRGDLMVFYDGNQYQELLEIDKEYTLADQTKIKFFEKIASSDLATNITSTIWPSNNPQMITALNPQPTMIDISSQTLNDKRHYLEINGNEVF